MTMQKIGQTFNNKLLLIFGVAILCFTVSTDAQTNNSYQLSQSITPTNYTLKLQPDLETKSFTGEVTIKMITNEEVTQIYLNSLNLNITKVEVSNSSNSSIPVASMNTNSTTETLKVTLQDPIEAKTICYLHITYTGSLDNGNVGWYESTTPNGETFVAANLKPTYARSLLPCFDEPEFKATYEISVTKPSNGSVLSNLNDVSNTTNSTNTDVVKFVGKSPSSPHLLNVVICNFDAKETEISNGNGSTLKVISYARKNQTSKMEYAHAYVEKAISYFSTYFDRPYPAEKCGVIAIPNYKYTGIAQSGLVTVKEDQFLIDIEAASSKFKKSVATTAAGLVAGSYMDFLVTEKSWDDEWVLKAISMFLAIKTIDSAEPSWNMMDQFSTMITNDALKKDLSPLSRPLSQNIENIDEIKATVDNNYMDNKAIALTRMMEDIVGKDGYRDGLRDCIKKNEYGNLGLSDLIACHEPYLKKNYSDANMTEIVDPWITQDGHPLLTVMEGDSNNTLVITQTRYIGDSEAVNNKNLDSNDTWYIKITYRTSEGDEGSAWLKTGQRSTTITLPSNCSWAKVNIDQCGYYMVQYPESIWQNFITVMKNDSKQMTVSDRANLLNDACTLSNGGHLSYAISLDLATWLKNETEFTPWKVMDTQMDFLYNRLSNTTYLNKMKTYARSLVKDAYGRIGWDNSSKTVMEGSLRAIIMGFALKSDLPEARERCQQQFKSWLNSTTFVMDPSTRYSSYQGGIKNATSEEWDEVWQRYQKETDSLQSTQLLAGLAASSNVNLLHKLLDNLSGTNKILTGLSLIAANKDSQGVACDYLKANYTKLTERFSLKKIGALLVDISKTLNAEFKLTSLKEFFTEHPEMCAKNTAKYCEAAMNNVVYNCGWINSTRKYEAVSTYLDKYIAN